MKNITIFLTLPHKIDNEWDFVFNLRRRNYETNSDILNKTHPENKGFFFFIGTRAENKFWEIYEYGMRNDDNVNDTQYIEGDYFASSEPDEIYIKEQISLDNIELYDSDGYPIIDSNIYEIETDNKFIIFNQTKDGYNIKTWKDDYKFID